MKHLRHLHLFARPAAPALLFCACMLAGCATKSPIEVKIPVTVPCVGEIPARPGSTFGAGKWPGDKAAAQAALIDSALWQGYATKLEVVVAGCR
ncbi:MAG: hypothetical protein M3Y65_15465 [Pseudomonadota bacterium]|nr:hypothetical protein [Pseudomonadota bacterium]